MKTEWPLLERDGFHLLVPLFLIVLSACVTVKSCFVLFFKQFGDMNSSMMSDASRDSIYYVSPQIAALVYTLSGVFLVMIGSFGIFANLVILTSMFYLLLCLLVYIYSLKIQFQINTKGKISPFCKCILLQKNTRKCCNIEKSGKFCGILTAFPIIQLFACLDFFRGFLYYSFITCLHFCHSTCAKEQE